MRFVITGEWTRPGLLRLIIAMFLLFVVLFWVTNLLLYFDRMSLTYASVVGHYLGTDGPWGAPAVARSYKVLLEISHAHLFAMGILVMTMAHLLLFVPGSNAMKAWIAIATFVSALLDEASGWLIRYVHPGFAYMKISMFVLFQLSLGVIIVMLIRALLTGGRNTRAEASLTSSGSGGK